MGKNGSILSTSWSNKTQTVKSDSVPKKSNVEVHLILLESFYGIFCFASSNIDASTVNPLP